MINFSVMTRAVAASIRVKPRHKVTMIRFTSNACTVMATESLFKVLWLTRPLEDPRIPSAQTAFPYPPVPRRSHSPFPPVKLGRENA